jgi:gas vesicle protein
MKNTGKILTAIAAGAAAGAVLGILFAPDKGTATRKKINSRGEKLADNIKYKFRRGKDKMSNLKDDIAQKINEKVKEFA